MPETVAAERLSSGCALGTNAGKAAKTASL